MNNTLLTYLAESGFCLTFFYVFYLVALRTETGFRYNRYYLLGALLLSFAVPLLPIPGWPEAAPETVPMQNIALDSTDVPSSAEMEMVAPVNAPATPSIDFWLILYGVYGAGVLFFAGRLVYQLLSIRAFMRRKADNLHVWENRPVILTDGQLTTFSFLGYIFFDNSQPLTPEEEERILQHEKAHLDQKHSFDLLLVQALQIIFWFNPLLVLYRTALIQTHEFLADAHVIQQTDKEQYSTLLLQQVFQQMGFALGHSFFKQKSFTLKRIQMMSKSNQTPNLLKYALVAPLLGCVFIGLSAHRPAEVKQAANLFTEQPIGSAPKSENTTRAQFPGGTEAAIQFLANNLSVPEATFKKVGEEKLVMIWEAEIQINRDGSAQYLNTTQLEVRPGTPEIKNVMEQAGIHSISKMPKWKPALKDGQPIVSKEKIKFAKVLAAHPTTAKPTLNASMNTQEGEKIFIAVEDPAEFPGGQPKLYEYLQERIKFTEALKAENVTGTAIASFVIDKEGKVMQTELLKKIHPEIDTQILKALEEMPAWRPAKQNGKAVALKLLIPYKIGSAKEASATAPAQIQEDQVYIAVSDPAEFPGGQPALYRYLQEKITLPAELKDKNVAGTAIASFIINKEGKVTQPKITTSVHPLLDAQILKAIEEMPQWKPAKQNGKVVLQKFQLPYRIEESKK